jgi:hypothetical protein
MSENVKENVNEENVNEENVNEENGNNSQNITKKIINLSRNLGLGKNGQDGSFKFMDGFTQQNATDLYYAITGRKTPIQSAPGKTRKTNLEYFLLRLYLKSLRAENIKLIESNSSLGYRSGIVKVVKQLIKEDEEDEEEAKRIINELLDLVQFNQIEKIVFKNQAFPNKANV